MSKKEQTNQSKNNQIKLDSNYLIGLKLSKFNLKLSKAEAILCFKAYFEVEEFLFFDNFLVLKVEGEAKQILSCLNRLAFTKEAYVLTQNEDWVNYLAKIVADFLPDSKDSCFKVCLPQKIDESAKTKLIDETASIVLKNNLANKISLSSADLVICAFCNPKMFGLLIWTNKDPFKSRRSHLKPAPHPSGIDPRIAKAMINLASAKYEVLDPFCGAGGILEEVKLLGLNYFGVDISWKMINLARSNLKSRDNLFLMSAFSWNKPVECVVTDLPYGKNSKLECELDSLIDEFFEHFKNFTSKIVVCVPHTYDVAFISKKNGWILVDFFDVYIHGSLTRRVHILKK